MARISGVDLPRDKKVEVGLTYIYGIGRHNAADILQKAGIERTRQAVAELTQGALTVSRLSVAAGLLADLAREG